MIDELLGMPRKKADIITTVSFDKNAFQKALSMQRHGNEINRELGAACCGRVRGRVVEISRLVEMPSLNFDRNSFWFDGNGLPYVRNRSCDSDQEIVAIFHTHPNGSSIPSSADVRASKSLGIVDCIAGRDDITCHLGKKILNVKSNYLKSNWQL